MSEKIYASKIQFFLEETEGLIQIIEQYLYDGVTAPDFAKDLIETLKQIVPRIQKVAAQNSLQEYGHPSITAYFSEEAVHTCYRFVEKALMENNPILEPFYEDFGYTLYDFWQADSLLFEDRKVEMPKDQVEI